MLKKQDPGSFGPIRWSDEGGRDELAMSLSHHSAWAIGGIISIGRENCKKKIVTVVGKVQFEYKMSVILNRHLDIFHLILKSDLDGSI